MAEIKKITKREVLKHILETYSNDEMVVNYATNELKLLDNRKSSKTETPTQKENVKTMEVIVNVLTELAKPARIVEIQASNEMLATLSNQKMSALLKKLVDNGTIKKFVDKKVTYFSI
jgi:hypothetical protein